MQASILQLGRGPSHSITCTKQSTLWARSFRQVEKSSWLLAGLHVFQSGVWANVDISEDFCRTPVAGSPNPRGSVEHRLRTTGLTQAIDQPRQQRTCMSSAAKITK